MPKIRIREMDLTTNPVVGAVTTGIAFVLNDDIAKATTVSSIFANGNNVVEITAEQAQTIENAMAPVSTTTSSTISAPQGKGKTATLSATDGEEEEETESQTATTKKINTLFLEECLSLGGKVYVCNSWDNAIAYLGDRNQYDIKFVLTDETNLENALKIAEKRKDCAVVLSTSSTTISDVASVYKECSYITTEGTDKSFYESEEKKLAGKYVLPFYAPKIFKTSRGTEYTITAGEAYILAYLNNVRLGRADYLAIAGAMRGEIPFNYSVSGVIKEDDIDAMQPNEAVEASTSSGDTLDKAKSVAVNPICKVNPWGTRIWGNRTALPNVNITKKHLEGSSDWSDAKYSDYFDQNQNQLVASSFASTRILICDLKKALYQASRRFQFEQDGDVLEVQFESFVNKTLESMKQNYGIATYRWYREQTTERAKLCLRLVVVPVDPVENFDLAIELNDSLENGIAVAE